MPIFTSNTGSSTLKAYFETGDVPTANNFIDLIDSFVVITIGQYSFLSKPEIFLDLYDIIIIIRFNFKYESNLLKNYFF